MSLRHRSARPPDPPFPVSVVDGVLSTPTGRFAVGGPGDKTLVGDWFCRGSPVPALLRPSTGEVFVFERWPAPGEELPGSRVGALPGASDLATLDDESCPSLAAVRNGVPEKIEISAKEPPS